MRDGTTRIVKLETERPEREGDFDQEERGDQGRDQGKDLQPFWRFVDGPAGRRRTVRA